MVVVVDLRGPEPEECYESALFLLILQYFLPMFEIELCVVRALCVNAQIQ